MNINPNISNNYINKIKAKCNQPTIIAAARRLINDASQHQSINKSKLIFTTATSKDFPILVDIIKVAYNGRYFNQDNHQVLSFNEIGRHQNITTFVAKHIDRHGHQLILCTLRLVKRNIELFDFFTYPDDRLWPYQERHQIPYEFERLAFHPYFDLVKDKSLQTHLVRQLNKVARQSITTKKNWLVCIMRPGVRDFIAAAGLKTKPIKDLQLANNATVKKYRQQWPSYWKEVAAYEVI